jgi:hypothetical protein
VHQVLRLSDIASCPSDVSTCPAFAQGAKLILFLKCNAPAGDSVVVVGQSWSRVIVHMIFGVIGDSIVVTAHLADRFAVLQLLEQVKSP